MQSNLEHLLIDDLCDMMRSKATCKDGECAYDMSLIKPDIQAKPISLLRTPSRCSGIPTRTQRTSRGWMLSRNALV